MESFGAKRRGGLGCVPSVWRGSMGQEDSVLICCAGRQSLELVFE